VDEYQIIAPCVRNIKQAEMFLPENKAYRIYDERQLESGKLCLNDPVKSNCEWIYSTVTVQVNGNVVPCCRDPRGKYVMGNVFEENIYDIWNNEKFRELRNIVAHNRDNFNLCKLCDGYSIPK